MRVAFRYSFPLAVASFQRIIVFLSQSALPLTLSIQHGFIDNRSLYTDLTILHHFLVRQSDAEVEMGNREESVTNTYRTR